MILSALTLLAAAATAPASRVHYDCVIEKQFVIKPEGGKWNEAQVEFPGTVQADWRFSVDLDVGAEATARVSWPKDLVQIAGEHAVLRLAPGHFAFAAAAQGNCMFTEEACLAMVELADRDANSASVLIAPAGLTLDPATGQRSLLHVSSLGQCRRTERPQR